MFATSSRCVNGRLRQQPFGRSNVLMIKDRAPLKKREKLKIYNFDNSKPVLFAPLGKIPSSVRQDNPSLKKVTYAAKSTSGARVRKNHHIELRTIDDDLQPLREEIAAMSTRQGGPYGRLGKGKARSTQDIRKGDFVDLMNESRDCGVVLQVDSQDGNIYLSRSGKVSNFNPGNVLLCFPQFVSEKRAKDACPIKAVIKDDVTIEEPFDASRFRIRARICKKLNLLQRQVESTYQILMPPFEDLFLSSAGQDSLQEDALTTPEVALKLVNHPLCVMRTKMGIDDEVEAGEGKEAELDVSQHQRMSSIERAGHINTLASAIALTRADSAKQTASSPATILATHHLLFANSHLFLFDPLKHNETQTFTVRPISERRALVKVTSWVQSALEEVSRGSKKEANPIRSFAARAKSIIKLRQDKIKATSADAPGEPRRIERDSHLPELSWTSEDLIIIQALRAGSSHQSRPGEGNALQSLIIYIAKECGTGVHFAATSMGQEIDQPTLYINQMPRMMSIDLLMRLGFIAPWESVPSMDNEFRQMIQEDRGVRNLSPTIKADPDEAIRVDFDLPVYVIDDVTAQELDDGVSIQATSHKDQYWIHVSIADPTTSFDLNDPIARQAQRRHNSLYTPNGQWSMLPSFITQQHGLRVDDKKEDKASVNAVQFSTLLDLKTGKAKQIDVKLVSLSDVRVMSYDQGDAILTKSDDGVMSQKEKEDIKLLHHAAISLERRRRLVGGALVAPGSSSSITLDPLPLPPSPIWQVTDKYAPPAPIFAGFPHIRHRIRSAFEQGLGPKFSLSHGTISELMILANRTASEWLSRRQLPALFNGQAAPAKIDDRQKLYDLRNDDGVIAYQKLLQSGVGFSAGASSVQMTEHFSLGIRTTLALQSKDQDALTGAGYARVTSPLRRYPDLLNHWQIKQSLRRGSDAAPLVSHQELLDMVPRVDRMNNWFKTTEKNANRFYFALKLYRGVQSRRGQVQLSEIEKEEVDAILDTTHEALVSIANVRINQALQAKVRVLLTTLGASAEMEWDPLAIESPSLGTKFNVKITDVFIAGPTGHIMVKPV